MFLNQGVLGSLGGQSLDMKVAELCQAYPNAMLAGAQAAHVHDVLLPAAGPRGSTYSAIMELGLNNHMAWFWGPNF